MLEIFSQVREVHHLNVAVFQGTEGCVRRYRIRLLLVTESHGVACTVVQSGAELLIAFLGSQNFLVLHIEHVVVHLRKLRFVGAEAASEDEDVVLRDLLAACCETFKSRLDLSVFTLL